MQVGKKKGVFPDGLYMTAQHLLYHSWTDQQLAEGFWTGQMAIRELDRGTCGDREILASNVRENLGALYPKIECPGWM